MTDSSKEELTGVKTEKIGLWKQFDTWMGDRSRPASFVSGGLAAIILCAFLFQFVILPIWTVSQNRILFEKDKLITDWEVAFRDQVKANSDMGDQLHAYQDSIKQLKSMGKYIGTYSVTAQDNRAVLYSPLFSPAIGVKYKKSSSDGWLVLMFQVDTCMLKNQTIKYESDSYCRIHTEYPIRKGGRTSLVYDGWEYTFVIVSAVFPGSAEIEVYREKLSP